MIDEQTDTMAHTLIDAELIKADPDKYAKAAARAEELLEGEKNPLEFKTFAYPDMKPKYQGVGNGK